MNVRGVKEQRLEWVLAARDLVEKARKTLEEDPTGWDEKRAALDSFCDLRDWSQKLEQDLMFQAESSAASDRMARFEAKLDKLEALFEKLVSQHANQIAARERFEREVLAQFEPLRAAVLVLLHKAPPTDRERAEAARRIQWRTEFPAQPAGQTP